MSKRTPIQSRTPVGKKTAVYRDFPDGPDGIWHCQPGGRKAVCKRCHAVMPDIEPSSTYGEYRHPSTDKDGKRWRCFNAGLKFTQQDLEILPFLRKAERRRNTRHGFHA